MQKLAKTPLFILLFVVLLVSGCNEQPRQSNVSGLMVAEADDPTATLVVSDTPVATDTLVPSETSTVTHTPEPSDTPEPSETSPPTNTPLPTNTLGPTNTLAPSNTPTIAPPPTVAGTSTGVVTRVVDGDTIDVSIGGVVYRVRYIGINTPESGEVCGSEASSANAALVSGQTVTLVKDVSEVDRFGRLLRYVYVGGLHVNAELARQGWAEAVQYPPDTSQAGTFNSLANSAAGAGLGCWAMGSFGGQAAVQPTATQEPIGAGGGGEDRSNCDPHYPTVCIPHYPPDLNCSDIPYRRFQVLQPDPHGFDRDKDGIGCESN